MTPRRRTSGHIRIPDSAVAGHNLWFGFPTDFLASAEFGLR
jgi:hypothetical protein